MPYEMKNNTGSLFANERREKDTHPHAKGTCIIEGREFYVDAWTNTTQGGKRYQSLKFKLKEQQPAQSGATMQDYGDVDDDIPF